ncbi:unnamed protein product [Dovyalis caffra]|uniref:Cytochrome P450 n=1 Tax=Dovyalis caffra TaxID=77055 RepID=A0AAV1RPN1_9ROSI|nr:unnamed protein product [Dovyalis caffra]
MVDFLRKKEGKRVQIREVVLVYSFKVLANIYFSKDIIDIDQGGRRVFELVRKIMGLFTTLNISDLYPILGSLDLQGLSRKSNECSIRIQELWENLIKERREGRKDAGEDDDLSKGKDFLDALLDGGYSDEQIHIIFLFLPFGSGRRICAGIPMVGKIVPLALAHLIHNFDWSLPNNMLPDELDMDERYGITMMKEQPLELVPKWKK